MRNGRIRHARREFKRAWPEVAEQVRDAQLKAARRAGWGAFVRNVLIGAAFAGVLIARCAL